MSRSLKLIFASLFLAAAQEESCSNGDGMSSDASSMLSIKTSVSQQSSVMSSQMKSMAMSNKFSDHANLQPDGSATKGLFESFKLCGQCKKFQRFGEPNDGGYLMCMDGLQKGSVSGAFSLGVEHHDQWSEDVIKNLGVTVNQFDCTVDSSDCKACKFHKKCVVTSDGKHPVPGHETEGWSLNQALSETGHGAAKDGSLLMKMDIESSEWPIYAQESPDVLKKFGELIVEFHQLQNEARHAEYLAGMQHILAAGFKVAHLHGNNYEGMYTSGANTIPNVLEVTFVHGDARAGGCSGDQIYSKELDAANNPTAPELPMAHIE